MCGIRPSTPPMHQGMAYPFVVKPFNMERNGPVSLLHCACTQTARERFVWRDLDWLLNFDEVLWLLIVHFFHCVSADRRHSDGTSDSIIAVVDNRRWLIVGTGCYEMFWSHRLRSCSTVLLFTLRVDGGTVAAIQILLNNNRGARSESTHNRRQRALQKSTLSLFPYWGDIRIKHLLNPWIHHHSQRIWPSPGPLWHM